MVQETLKEEEGTAATVTSIDASTAIPYNAMSALDAGTGTAGDGNDSSTQTRIP